MDKKIIKTHLSKTFLNEGSTPGISVTDKMKKESGKINKDGLKAYSKEVKAKEDKDTKQMAKNKFNYADDFEKTYHEEMEIMNGLEMNQYDNKPDSIFADRAKQGIEGSSRMGNENKIGNAEAAWGASSDDFGKDLTKRIKASQEKRSKQTPDYGLQGKDVLTSKTKDLGHKPYALSESISDRNKMVLSNWVEKMGAQKAAEKLINTLSQTGMISDLPDSNEYGSGLNRVEAYLSKKDFDKAYKTAKSLATRLEKKAMRDMMGENEDEPKDKTKDFNDGEDYEKISREVEYGTNPNSEDNNNKPQIKESMKRLKFKTNFNGLGNALKLIPEGYRVDKKEFEMTDGNETYRIRWEGNLNEGKAVVLTASDKKLVNEDINRMKELFGYKSQDTLGLVKGNARVNENKVFGDIWNKSKQLLGESEEIEGYKTSEGNWDEEKKKAPEATKHVSSAKGGSKMMKTEAPKASEGNPDKAKSQAPEATKHVSTAKVKTTEVSEEYWEDVTGGEKMFDGQVSKPKEGRWEDNVKGQAAEAKKHVHLKESEMEEELMEIETDDLEDTNSNDSAYEKAFSSMNGEDEEDTEEKSDNWNTPEDDDSSDEMEPSSSEISDDLPMDDSSEDDEEEEVVIAPKPMAKGGAQLLFSPSQGVYWIKGPGLPMNGMEVPNKFLSIASDKSKKSAEKAAMIINMMDEMGPEDEMEDDEY
jgi:hypothetical protein